MKKIFVKICGITNCDDAFKVCSLGVDAIGFIAYTKSKRFIEPDLVKGIVDKLSEFKDLNKVGVFVNSSIEIISDYIRSGINVIQLHGDETQEYIEELYHKLIKNSEKRIEVWKAVRPLTLEDVKKAEKFSVDKILIDTYSKNEYGGTGVKGNWKLAEYAVENFAKPIIIAGGLTPDNILDSISSIKPFGIDLSSGLESSPGIKKHELIELLFKKLQKLN